MSGSGRLRLHRQAGQYRPVAVAAARLAIPLMNMAELETTTPLAPPAALVDGPVNILLVDDEARNLDVLESILEAPDRRLVRALSAEETLLALIQRDFVAIVLDVQMPGMNGFELARVIKQRKRTRHIPIIFLTAYFQDE